MSSQAYDFALSLVQSGWALSKVQRRGDICDATPQREVDALSLCYRGSTVFFVLNLLLPLSERLLWKKCQMPLNVPS